MTILFATGCSGSSSNNPKTAPDGPGVTNATILENQPVDASRVTLKVAELPPVSAKNPGHDIYLVAGRIVTEAIAKQTLFVGATACELKFVRTHLDGGDEFGIDEFRAEVDANVPTLHVVRMVRHDEATDSVFAVTCSRNNQAPTLGEVRAALGSLVRIHVNP